jgi:hypothetical protein
VEVVRRTNEDVEINVALDARNSSVRDLAACRLLEEAETRSKTVRSVRVTVRSVPIRYPPGCAVDRSCDGVVSSEARRDVGDGSASSVLEDIGAELG